MTITSLVSLIQSAIGFGTVIMFGAAGEVIAEKSGSLNLGVPGIMYIGGIAGLSGAFLYELNVDEPNKIVCILISLLACLVASFLAGLIYSFLTITLRANQNVTGLTLTIFGSGIANFFGGSLNKLAGGVGQISVAATSSAYGVGLPFAKSFGYVGKLLFSYGWLTYLAIIIVILSQFYISKTRSGLALRAVGENPATADAAGIRVTKYKYLATCIGASISGLGGLYYVVDYTKGTWANDGTIESLGWLALALVIFATWKPVNTIWGSYLFGVLYWLHLLLGIEGRNQELFKMLPYIVTLVVLIATSMRKKKENQPPAHLGLPYFREER